MFGGQLFACTVFVMIIALHASAASEYVSPETVAGASTIDRARAKALFDQGAIFIDVRSKADWGAGRIPGAVHLELEKVFTEDALKAVARLDQDVVMYCNGIKCPRSSTAAAAPVKWDYSRVYYYRLGFPDWQAAGYPVE